jgi:hypothetical protein
MISNILVNTRARLRMRGIRMKAARVRVQASWMYQVGVIVHWPVDVRVKDEESAVLHDEQEVKVLAVQVRQGSTQDILGS